MRSVASRRSSASERAPSDAATQRTAAGSAGPAWRATASSHSASSPAAASGSASSQAPVTPCASSNSPIASSASATASASPPAADPLRRHRVALQVHEPLGVLARDAGLDEVADRPAEHVERVAQGGRVAPGGGRRVVELVRQAGGHLAQRGQLLALHGGGLEAAVDRPERAHDPLEGRARVDQQPAEGLGRDAGHAAALGGADADGRGVAGQGEDRPQERRRMVGVVALLAPVALDEAVQRALEQEAERRHLVADADDRLAGLQPLVGRGLGPARDLLVADPVEQVDRAQLLDGEGHVSARY